MIPVRFCEACRCVESEPVCADCGGAVVLRYLADPEQKTVLQSLADAPRDELRAYLHRNPLSLPRRVRDALRAELYRRDVAEARGAAERLG